MNLNDLPLQAGLRVSVQRTHPDAKLPQYATSGSACFDLCSLVGGTVQPGGGTLDCSTGLAFEVPPGHAMLVFSRSGHAFKHGVRLANSVGVIDSDYRGTVRVKLVNDSHATYHVRPGERIAQAMILPMPLVSFDEAQALPDTERGAGGFGSTGA